MTTRGLPLADRFALGVEKRGPDDCWPWLKAQNRQGYGLIRADGRTLLAHRVAYQVATEEDITGRTICHRCDNPQCVNPAHLWAGSVGANNADRHLKQRSRGGTMRGTANPMARLTESQVIEIAEGTETLESAAAKYGVPFQTVSDIRRGKSWSHVTGRQVKPWRINGLGPQERAVLNYMATRCSSGPATFSDATIAEQLGLPSRTAAAYAKHRLAKRGLIKKVSRCVWDIERIGLGEP